MTKTPLSSVQLTRQYFVQRISQFAHGSDVDRVMTLRTRDQSSGAATWSAQTRSLRALAFVTGKCRNHFGLNIFCGRVFTDVLCAACKALVLVRAHAFCYILKAWSLCLNTVLRVGCTCRVKERRSECKARWGRRFSPTCLPSHVAWLRSVAA